MENKSQPQSQDETSVSKATEQMSDQELSEEELDLVAGGRKAGGIACSSVIIRRINVTMPAFRFKSILLHALPDNGGWEVYGIPHSELGLAGH